VAGSKPLRETAAKRRMVFGGARLPLAHTDALVTRPVELRPHRSASGDRVRPLAGIPARLRAKQDAGPQRIDVLGLEAVPGAKVTHPLLACVRRGDEFGGGILEAVKVAHRRARDHQGVAMANKANYAIARRREPERYARIQNLVRRRVPTVAENDRSRAGKIVVNRQVYLSPGVES